MASRNDITGDALKSRAATEAYLNNWDAIFGKKKATTEEPEVADDPKEQEKE